MTMIQRVLRDSGATPAVSMDGVSSILLFLGHVASGMVSLEIKLVALFVISIGLLRPLQSFLVGRRRRSRHWFIQYTAMVAYYLPTPLAFYAVNAVTSTSHLDECPFNMTFVNLFLFFTLIHSTEAWGEGNMRAYSLRDGPPDLWRFVLSVVYLVCMEWEWSTGISRGNGDLLFRMIAYFVSLHILFTTSYFGLSNLDYETKAFADYMNRESKSSSPFFDDSNSDGDANSSLQLDCCRYPFMQRKEDRHWINIKDLLQRDDLSKEDQNIWLSYSLCRLLARRYYGFQCAEEGDSKVRRFALARLGTDGYKRAFTIVEVQLAFLHDYFFTNSLLIMRSKINYMMQHKIQTSAKWPSIVCILSIAMAGQALAALQDYDIPYAPYVTGQGSFFPPPTMIIVFAYILITPEERYVDIYWRPIYIVFHKLNLLPASTNIMNRFLRQFYQSLNEPDGPDVHRPYQTQASSVYWRDQIGQYSVLLDYDRRRSRKKALVAWFQRLVRPQPLYEFIKHLPVEEEDVKVPDSVRELVAETLLAIYGPPTNGTRSLKINMKSAGYDWSWTCREVSHTDTILIWHIATCYCDMTPISDDPFVKWHHEPARALSRYCAYLVAFLPEFLPDHSLTTKEVFQRVLQEAQQELGTEPMKEEEKHTKIRGLQLPDQHEQRTTFHKGVELGRQLEMLNDDSVRWRVIAEFWAETILYIAPSDNAEAHIEHLAKGGEFITHLWAMLSNAGILKRATGEWHPPPPSTTTEGPPMHQHTEALSSSIDEASTSSTTKKGPQKKIATTKARTQECPF